MKADPAVLKDMVKAFENRRELVLNALDQMPGVKTNRPQGAFYVFPDISAFFGKQYNGHVIRTANDLALYILDQGLVAIVTGEAFGDPNCIRISYAASEEVLTEAMKRIKEALSKLS
jgi:aspartate aminotransferase